MKHQRLTPTFVEFVPRELDEGVLYISMTYATASHLCACGCGERVVTPLGAADWTLIFDGTVTLDHSVGNGQFECQSHYFIRGNDIRWVPAISKAATTRALGDDRNAHVGKPPSAGVAVPAKTSTWSRITRIFRRGPNG